MICRVNVELSSRLFKGLLSGLLRRARLMIGRMCERGLNLGLGYVVRGR